MNHCVNINSKEFKDLVKVANMNPVILAAKVSIWQEENGLDKFPKLSQLISENAINYVMDAAQILSSPEADVVFKKAEKGKWPLDKVLTELQIPKTQKEIILQSGKTDRKDIVTDLLVNYSYAVEINIGLQNNIYGYRDVRHLIFENITSEEFGLALKKAKQDIKVHSGQNEVIITEDGVRFTHNGFLYEYNASEQTKKKAFIVDISQYYSNLTVPGGTNYTEQEISTPAITPSIKGHAQFATDKGIGWFRSDDKLDNADLKNKESIYPGNGNPEQEGWEIVDFDEDGPVFKRVDKITDETTGTQTKTRRILEVQSDLFQKGRDKNKLAGAGEDESFLKPVKGTEDEMGIPDFEKDIDLIQQNQFLQLLNKDNNWVTFFVKAVIQDSAKKGYEKVLFPTGNTASKVEGHTTLEEFKKQKEDSIKKLEKQNKKYENINKIGDSYIIISEETGDEFEKQITNDLQLKDIIDKRNENNNEINQLKQELERVETEGFGALKPIYNFYENTVTNILKKQGYLARVVVDEYGNTWNEVELDENKKQSISLTSKNFNNFVNETYEESMFSFLTKESDHREYFNNCK